MYQYITLNIYNEQQWPINSAWLRGEKAETVQRRLTSIFERASE